MRRHGLVCAAKATRVTVASATTTSNQEVLNYAGVAGYYRWRILAYSGSGADSLGFNIP